MNTRRLLLLLFLQCFFFCAAFAQKQITGKVVDSATGEPLSGVSVLSDKKKTGGTTAADGSYKLSVDSKTSVVLFSSVGYTPQSFPVSTVPSVVRLTRAASALDEVVVIGYGTVRKSHLTGAVSKFKNEKLEEAPVSRLDQALQGKIAGVQIQNTSSEAGSDPKIRIRGGNSINASADPLVVVDGHPVPDGLSYVNPADVESVEVLKDAASAAIYGSRGASGVIIITTKSGKANRSKYSLKASTGTKSAYERYPMLTMTEYGNLLYYEASLKAKDPSITPPTTSQIMTPGERAGYIIEQTLLGGQPTDWQSQALRDATVRNLQLSVSGGSNTAKYFISGAYQKDDGMMYHSNYDRFNLRTRLDVDLSKRVKLSFNINPSYIKRERPSVNYIDFVRFYSFLPVYHNDVTAAFANQSALWGNLKPGDFAQARHFNGRIYSGYMPDGTLYNTVTAVDPFSTANNTPKSIMETRSITSNDYRVMSSGDLSVNILKGLDFKTMASAYIVYSNALDFAKRNSNKDGDVNRAQYNSRLMTDLLWENTLTYNKRIGGHSFTLLGGFTAQKTRQRDEQQQAQDFPSDNFTTMNNAAQVTLPYVDANGVQQGTFNTKFGIGLLSYLGRLTYDYKSKYLLSASLRSDGSSKFAPGHKWGTFPAVSLGWVATQEKFLQGVKWLDNLKFRGSYGVTGNNRINDFLWVDLLYASNYDFGSGNGTLVSGQAPTNPVLANKNITWEQTYQYNFGVDVSLFHNALSLSVDAYQSKTKALLLQQAVMAFLGSTQTINNIGQLQNRGIETELTANIMRRKNFRWTALANIAHNENKLLALAGEQYFLNYGERTEVYRNMPGRPLVEFFGYKTDGVWLSQQQINDAKAKGLTSNLSNLFVAGGLKLVDVNGDNVIDDKDRVVMGNPYPAYTWGLTNNVTCGQFDFSILLQGSQGGQLINGDANYNETKRINKNYIENRWLSPAYPGDGKTPYSTNGFNWMLTDYVVEDASYYALREVIVGYTLPAKLIRLAHLSSARFYFSAQNLYYHSASGYRGINPEARFSTGQYATPLVDGYQRGSFPLPRTVLFGLDINF
ncbi:SusC/RagA family TonB-linked outer membrane protein [Flavisolibacter ginsenosidimutans]|uniref:TonB-dependent receptor n=1 Tax=Flavisolibacter ginsenosidimutans TaxID=661481 RepID=A0A5B8UI06_9BACT|nr:TonB-dependent receptor [Flavisolibacter ginsenosidimutans]QEC55799.1 TonB-dependent receptor [Flavisolibacter ginsenosidimutans]